MSVKLLKTSEIQGAQVFDKIRLMIRGPKALNVTLKTQKKRKKKRVK